MLPPDVYIETADLEAVEPLTECEPGRVLVYEQSDAMAFALVGPEFRGLHPLAWMKETKEMPGLPAFFEQLPEGKGKAFFLNGNPAGQRVGPYEFRWTSEKVFPTLFYGTENYPLQAVGLIQAGAFRFSSSTNIGECAVVTDHKSPRKIPNREIRDGNGDLAEGSFRTSQGDVNVQQMHLFVPVWEEVGGKIVFGHLWRNPDTGELFVKLGTEEKPLETLELIDVREGNKEVAKAGLHNNQLTAAKIMATASLAVIVASGFLPALPGQSLIMRSLAESVYWYASEFLVALALASIYYLRQWFAVGSRASDFVVSETGIIQGGRLWQVPAAKNKQNRLQAQVNRGIN